MRQINSVKKEPQLWCKHIDGSMKQKGTGKSAQSELIRNYLIIKIYEGNYYKDTADNTVDQKFQGKTKKMIIEYNQNSGKDFNQRIPE